MSLENTREAAEPDKSATMPSSANLMKRRKKRALWLAVSMLFLSLSIIILGAYTTTRTESLNVTGYASGLIVAFGSFLGVLGLCLDENRKQLIVAAIIFLSFGIIASFFCLVVDGVFILLNIDMRPVKAGRCQFYTSGNGYIYENYYTAVPCQGLMETCTMKVRSGTCYCCDLYDCANGGYLNNYYEFVGVRSCQEVLTLYKLIWGLTALNLVAFILSILTTAVLGSIKDLKSDTVGQDMSSQLPVLRHVGPRLQDGEDILSPTAPLLPDHAGHSVHCLYPSTSLHFTPAVGREGAQSLLSENLGSEPNPPPFAPLYKMLP